MAKKFDPIYALRDGSIISINDITDEERGLKCNCVCSACGDRLEAKIKAERRKRHFAHYSRQDCEYGYESSLHLAAKDLLSKASKMVIPPVYVRFPGSYKKAELVSKAKEIQIERVELEKRVGSIIPDIVVYSGGKCLFVEIFVTHPIDNEKLEKIRNENISTIEVDLSRLNQAVSVEELSDYLLEDNDLKTWKFNRVSELWLKRFLTIADEKDLVSRGMTIHVDYCPLRMRVWNGKPYANFIDDCQGCRYLIACSEGKIRCSGRQKIATVADFSIPEADRVKSPTLCVEEKIIQSDEERMIPDISNGKCPLCGGRLVVRNGRFGRFWGCSSYPYCSFRAPPIIIKGSQ